MTASQYRLVVEGKDDKHSVIGLMKRHAIDCERIGVQIFDAQCVEKLLSGLTAEIKSYNRLGVVVDADTSLQDRWAQIDGRVRSLDSASSQASIGWDCRSR